MGGQEGEREARERCTRNIRSQVSRLPERKRYDDAVLRLQHVAVWHVNRAKGARIYARSLSLPVDVQYMLRVLICHLTWGSVINSLLYFIHCGSIYMTVARVQERWHQRV